MITGQVPELVLYNKEEYSLAGVKGRGLFSPDVFGIMVKSSSTACWRGFQMGYKIENNEFLLDWMFVNSEEANPPLVNGIEAHAFSEKYSMFSYKYENLNIRTKFTGKFLIGKDFIREMYVHMGFQKPITYKTVLEVFVEEGSITKIKDRSVEIEKIRKKARNFDPEEDSVQKFIHDSFSLEYDL